MNVFAKRILGALFLFVFVFSLTATVATDVSAIPAPCCHLQCGSGCGTVWGQWKQIGGGGVCLPVVAGECYNGDCPC